MKSVWTVIALGIVLGLAGSSAQAAKGSKAPKPAAGANKKAESIVGTVLKIDGASIVVQTRGKNAAEVTVATDNNTKFQINGAAGALADVKPGMNLVATPNTGTAQQIVAATGGTAGKGGKKKNK